MGVVVVVAVSLLSPRGVRRAALGVYLVSIAAMVLLPFFGHDAKGAARWVDIAGFTLQPSEFMKPALIVLVAWMFAEGQKAEGMPGVSIAFVLYFLAVALLLMEPDVGQTILITAAFGAAFWVAGVPTLWVLALGGFSIAGLAGAYFAFPHVVNARSGLPSSRQVQRHPRRSMPPPRRSPPAASSVRGRGRG